MLFLLQKVGELMTQTQLASMYLGNPDIADRDERLRGVSSQINATIHILDGQSNQGIILDYITAKNIIDDTHRKSLTDTLETYNFITFADKRFSQFLEKRNRIIIPDEDGTLREFVIFEAAKYKDTEGHKAQVYSHASYLELKKATILYPSTFEGTATQHGGRYLNDTGWQVGIVESSGTRTLTIEKHTNPYEMLKRIAKEFELELRFRIEHDGNKVTGRYVDMLERVGEWRGREVEFGKDLDGIRRVEKQDVVTALLGIGPEREDGSRIEVLVEDEDALKRWGREDEYGELHHLIEPYEIQSERDNMTTDEARQYTRTALNKRINTSVTYECTIIDLENAPGMENKKIRHGDTIRIKDTHFNPPLYLEARVFESDRSIKSKAKKDIKLGDFVEFTEEEVNAIWTMLQREIRKKVDIAKLEEYAEPKKIESPTAPAIKESENPIWVDTSRTPHVSHVANAGEWVKMTPTTPGEVEAYTKKEVNDLDSAYYEQGTEYTDEKAKVEAEEKAAQALADAKAFAKNADNITEGVIDVGAIPLRTSITGARLEWDGINGLVQYDSAGNAVSWLDLDANAHFANAFLSGRIEALEGFFAGDISGSSGTFGEVTATDGYFNLQDASTNTKYSATPRRNILRDHSFELLTKDFDSEDQASHDHNWLDVLTLPQHIRNSPWEAVGSPKVAVQFAPASVDALPLFGDSAAIVRNAHYYRQYIYDGVGAGSVYTVSGHFKRQWNTSPGAPVIQIWRIGSNGREERIISETFPTVSNDYSVELRSATFTVPSTFVVGDSLEIIFSGADSNWVHVDGVQLVEGTRASVYQPEDSVWEMAKGNYRPVREIGSPLWFGERYPTGTQTLTPEKTLEQCANGWMLQWQNYVVGEGATNSNYQYTFIPKEQVRNSTGNRVQLGGTGGVMVSKYLYIYNDRITGHSSNNVGDSNKLAITGVYEW